MPALSPPLYAAEQRFFSHLSSLSFREPVVVLSCRRSAFWYSLTVRVLGREYELAAVCIDARRLDGALRHLAEQLVALVARDVEPRQLPLEGVAS